MPPITLLIKPASSLCNMRCRYCFYADVSDNRDIKSFGVMDDETLEILVKKSLLTADGSCTFAFQGGEPTLAGLDFYRKLIELEKKHNTKNLRIFNSIQTNGYIIDEEWAKFLSENKFLVGLSLDGPKEIHDSLRLDSKLQGTFDKIINTAELFDKYNVEYNILTVVTSLIAKNAKKVYNFYRQKNLKYIQYIPCLDPFDNSHKDYYLSTKDFEIFMKATFDEYYKDFKNGRPVSVRTFDNYVGMLMGMPPESCGMSGFCTKYYVIEGNGNVYPCDFYVLDEFLMGNIKTDSFKELEDSDAANIFVEKSRFVTEKCKNCKWYSICRGGCRRHREPFVDGHPGQNKFCSAYMGFFNYSYQRLCEIAQSLMHNNSK